MEVTFNNVRECEQAGMVGLIAYSPGTGEQFPINSSKFGKVMAYSFPDKAVTDRNGDPFVIAMSSTDVLVTAIIDTLLIDAVIAEVEDIIADFDALDRLEKRGYFG